MGRPTQVVRGARGAVTVLGASAALAASSGATAVATDGSGVSIRPPHRPAYSPTLGDWEGSVDGFPASFALARDAKVPRGDAGIGVSRLVAFAPSGCPVSPSHTSETVLNGRAPAHVRASGAITGLGLDGGLTGAHSATLRQAYRLGSCRGTLTWHMHPATRRSVSDGAWKLRFGTGAGASFDVTGGGRLAAAVPLPQSLGLCHGLTGTLDAFIGPTGDAVSVAGGLRITLAFAGDRATGTLLDRAAGCATRTIRLTASH